MQRPASLTMAAKLTCCVRSDSIDFGLQIGDKPQIKISIIRKSGV